MLKFDDYSGQLFDSETDRKTRQPPKLTPQEIRQERKNYYSFEFYRQLMQWGTFSRYLIDGFGRRLEPEISTEEFLRQTRQHIEETEAYLRRRREQLQHDTRKHNQSQ